MPKLTTAPNLPMAADRAHYYRSKMVHSSLAVGVRFLYHGQALNLTSGSLASRGSNVIYHPMYWNFTRDTALELAAEFDLKAVFDQSEGKR